MADPLKDLVDAARELSAAEPRTLHGRKAAVYDLMLDLGARFDGEASAYGGTPVVFDEEVPRNTVEVRDGDGQEVGRLIQLNGQWYEVNAACFDLPAVRGRDLL